MRARSTTTTPGLLGVQVDPAGERLVDPKIGAGDGRRDQARGLVLVDVVRLEPGGDDGLGPGARERREVVRPTAAAPS